MKEPTGKSGVAELALFCISQLEHEEAMLHETLEVVRAIRVALINQDLAQLSVHLEDLQRIGRSAAELARNRIQLRERISRTIGVEFEQAMLRTFAMHVQGDLRDRLLDCRQRLASIANEVDIVNRANAGLVRHSLDLMRQLLEAFTGADSVGSNRYAATGQVQTTSSAGSLIQRSC